MAAPAAKNTCPHPIAHCDICRSREACAKRCWDDDHLSLVVGISKLQINELTAHGVVTVQGLATMPLPLDWKPDRSSADSYIRIREQAQVVVEARATAQVRTAIGGDRLRFYPPVRAIRRRCVSRPRGRSLRRRAWPRISFRLSVKKSRRHAFSMRVIGRSPAPTRSAPSRVSSIA